MNYFYINNFHKAKGKKDASIFFDKLCRHSLFYFKKYYDRPLRKYREHGFSYGSEQVIKTFITLAINDITDTFFIQENPVSRRKMPSKENPSRKGNGRVDYLAHYNKTSFLIEVKDSWIRYYDETNEFTFYKNIKYLLKKAKNQVHTVRDRDSYKNSKNLYGIALVVAPIYYRIDKNEKFSSFVLDSQTKEILEETALNLGFNVFSFWKLPKHYLEDEFFVNHRKQKENNVGLAFLGWIKKL